MRNGQGVGGWVQVSRLGNPLINEVIIPTDLKDHWNASSPADDKQFLKYYTNPILATVLQKLYPQFGPFTDTGRSDLVAGAADRPEEPALNYTGPTLADELRLNLSIPPTPLDKINRLGVLGGDLAGYPNGRRLADDVVDISERAVGGALIGHSLPLGDGVDANDVAEPARVPLRCRSVQRLRQHEEPDAPEDGLVVRTRLAAMGVAALAATLVILFGGVFRHERVAIASSALPTAVVEQLQRGFATGDTAALVTGLQSELRADPGSVKTLGLARPRLRATRSRDRRLHLLRQG